MILTDISHTKQGNIALFLDGEFAFSMAPEAYAMSGMRVGDALDEDTVEELRQEAAFQKAKAKALTLLSYKEYTTAELRKRLCGVTDPDTAQRTVDRMEELGLLNDEDYAQRYAQDLARRRGFGERRIRMEMRQKGLPPETIDFAVSFLETDPVAQARELLEKKYPLWQEDERVKRRAYGALVRRGFGSDDIRRAMADNEYD